mgnify:CR=1 FL=1
MIAALSGEPAELVGEAADLLFHLMVLQHAFDLKDQDPVAFCRAIDVPESFATEFRKMIALRRLMREQSIGLAFF